MIIIGDTHSIRPIFAAIDDNNIENQNIIHVGDVGIGFLSVEQDVANLQLLDRALIETNNKLYLIRGNHDFKKFWHDEQFKSSLPIFKNIIFVRDYSVIEIENKNILFIGGAISIDRSYRKRMSPSTWDEDEKFVYDEEKIKGMRNIDVVITHNAPHFCPPVKFNNLVNNWHNEEFEKDKTDLKAELTQERMDFTKMWMILRSNNNITDYIYGHFHKNSEFKKDGCIFTCLGISELKKL